MPGEILAQHDLIAAKIKDFETQHAKLAQAITDLKRDEDAITTGSNWRGTARDAFNAFMERYYFQADRLNDKLLQTSLNLGKMNSQFSDQSADFTSQIQAQVDSLNLPKQ